MKKTNGQMDKVNKQMDKVNLIKRNKCLQNKEKINSKKTIPLVLEYNRTLSDISEIVKKLNQTN